MVVIVAPPVTLVKLFVSSGTSRAINTRHHPCNSHSTAFQLFVKALYFLALTLASSIALIDDWLTIYSVLLALSTLTLAIMGRA